MIILSGASGGIGRAVLPQLAGMDQVIAIYHSKPPDIDELHGVTASRVDLTSEQEILEFTSRFSEQLQRITLIYAAAVSRDALAAQLGSTLWDHVIDVNLRASFLLTRALLAPMIEQGWGRLIYLSSVAGLRGVPGTLAYSTSKTGLQGMSRVLAHEYGRFGITSNVLVLGYFDTGLISTLREDVREVIVRSIPSGQLGDPQNIVNAVRFLICSEYVNGSDIHIDGGI